MQKVSRLVLLVVASVTFVAGLAGAIISFPESGEMAQARGSHKESAEGGLAWQRSLSEASEQAKKEHKYVLADVYTDWCGWCKRLDKDVFTNADVISYLQKDFICVKVNAEDPKEGALVARTYQVNGFPCALVFSPEGKLIGKVEGYEKAPDYIESLKQMRQPQSSATPADDGQTKDQ
ncbi:MAG: thioredoxin family protein [Cyanobacteria bacterium SZAS LIN-2]|nr:thioredoxin family protein [Cyanobacteria bacterium SZAS LIN-3]MBS1996786.1 thioredoxin family protein [Cyanobacteria bacterium SZAS LIN-2]